MTTPTTQRWCHACSKYEDWNAGNGWFALRINGCMECIIASMSGAADPHDYYDDALFVCGQTPALILLERFLHTETFNPPTPAEPATQPDQFEALT